jgi:hypothetical protein
VVEGFDSEIFRLNLCVVQVCIVNQYWALAVAPRVSVFEWWPKLETCWMYREFSSFFNFLRAVGVA